MTGAPTRAATTSPALGLAGLLPFLDRRRPELVFTVLAGVLGHLATMAALGVAAWLVGVVLTGTGEVAPPVAYVLAGTVVAAAIGRWLQTYCGHDLAFALIEVLQLGIFDGLERAAPRYVLGRRTGDLAATATDDASALEGFYAHVLADYCGAALAPVAALVVLAWIHPLCALLAGLFIPVIASAPFWLARRAGQQGDVLRDKLGALNAEVVEGVQGLRELLAFGAEERFLESIDRSGRSLHRAQLEYGRRSGLEQAVVDLLLMAVSVSSIALAAYLFAQGEIAATWAPVVAILSGAAMVPLTQATESARKLGELRASARRVLTILHQPAVVSERPEALPVTPGEIRFQNVAFGYADDGPLVLKGADFTVGAGETVALVGASGEGKTTCANLIQRFWDVSSGCITIGGTDIRDLQLQQLRAAIGFVPQDSHLFNLSVADNIRLARPDADLAEVRAAAAVAQAEGFIAALPEGYDTLCGERGLRLSGGQRQRIALARAVLKRAPILVLDEPAANLDAENERALEMALHAVRRGRTVIVIAHRLSTIRSADRILVLKDGEVVETGRHDELIGKSGVYASLVASGLAEEAV